MKIPKNTLFILLGVLILILSASFLLASWIDKKNDYTKSKVLYANEITHTLLQINGTVSGIESATDAYLVTGKPEFDSLQSRSKHRLDSLVTAASLLAVGDPLQERRINQLGELLKQKISENDSIILIHDHKVQNTTTQLLLEDETIDRSNEYNDLYKTILSFENNEKKNWFTENRRSIVRMLFTVLLGSFVILLILTLFLSRLGYLSKKRKEEAEKTIRDTNEKYRKLIDDARVVMYTSDIRGTFRFITERVFKLTGYSKEGLLGQNYSMLVAPESLTEVSAHYRRQIELGIPETELEFPIVLKNGSRLWVEQRAILLSDEQNRPTGFQCIVKDIDDKKRLQIEKQEEEKKRTEYQIMLQAILDNSPSMIFVKDTESRYQIVNKKFEEVVGLNSNDIIGKDDTYLNTSDAAQKYHQDDHWVITHRAVTKINHPVNTPDGQRDYMFIKFPIPAKDGIVSYVCCIATDVTEQREHERELEEAREKAEKAEKAQEQFLASISHEIRNPLNGIIGMNNLMSSTTLNNEQQEFVAGIAESARTLLLLINDLLDIAKIKAGKLDLEDVRFSLKEVITKSLFSLQWHADEKGLDMQVVTDPCLPPILIGDPLRLSQVVYNLITNAIKFTDKGYVKLTTTVEKKDEHTAWIKFKVEDSGIGIPADKISSLFKDFVQASRDTVRKYGGTGLGLAITDKLVKMQGGQVEVASEEGKGSTFTIVIPYPYDEKREGDQIIRFQDQLDSGIFNKIQVLVVEDNLINQKIARYMLQKAGARVTIAENGKEAITALQNGLQPEIILMDLMMPVMNGYETITYIRKTINSNIPVIAMTATLRKEEQEKCLNAGMTACISKPFSPTQLFDTIGKILHPGDQTVPVITSSADNKIQPRREVTHYNLSYLDELEDDAYTREVIEIFLNTTPSGLLDIEQACRNQEWAAVHTKAHKLKSTLGLLQMTPLLDYIGQIETSAGNKENLEVIPRLLKEAQAEYAVVSALIAGELKRI